MYHNTVYSLISLAITALLVASIFSFDFGSHLNGNHLQPYVGYYPRSSHYYSYDFDIPSFVYEEPKLSPIPLEYPYSLYKLVRPTDGSSDIVIKEPSKQLRQNRHITVLSWNYVMENYDKLIDWGFILPHYEPSKTIRDQKTFEGMVVYYPSNWMALFDKPNKIKLYDSEDTPRLHTAIHRSLVLTRYIVPPASDGTNFGPFDWLGNDNSFDIDLDFELMKKGLQHCIATFCSLRGPNVISLLPEQDLDDAWNQIETVFSRLYLMMAVYEHLYIDFIVNPPPLDCKFVEYLL